MAKDTTNNTRSFSIFFLNKYKKLEMGCTSYHNNIVWSRNGEEQARIDYDIKTTEEDSYIHLKYKVRTRGEEEWRSMDYKIPLESVRCHFGGNRWYFRCSLSKSGVYCGRRVAILYSAGDYFGCRHCADLTYDSCLVGQRIREFPRKTLSDAWKADEIYANLKLTHYNGKPTRKYKRCLKLWGSEDDVPKADKQHSNKV
jgi:hypothetical protein